MKKDETIYQVMSQADGGESLYSYSNTIQGANEIIKEAKEMWPDGWFWIEQGTRHIPNKCRGCGTPYANEQTDYFGITTGYWCSSCYESPKYPYRKDKYPTIEHDGYGERLEDDY